VCPVVDDTGSLVLAAELDDGTVIVGQNNVSHPPHNAGASVVSHRVGDEVDKASAGKCGFDGGAKIRRMMYINSDGSENFPTASVTTLEALARSKTVVYAMGSVFTSIIPTLIVPGIADAIASKSGPKVLLLNGTYDRETLGLTAADIVKAIVSALGQHTAIKRQASAYESSFASSSAVLSPPCLCHYPRREPLFFDAVHDLFEMMGWQCDHALDDVQVCDDAAAP
jgi:2-phospho-L-lactate transferase/gluconeogenesis factor (CofD/UPF0052 family)